MASGPTTSWEIDGETVETVSVFIWAPKSLQMVIAAMKLKEIKTDNDICYQEIGGNKAIIDCLKVWKLM